MWASVFVAILILLLSVATVNTAEAHNHNIGIILSRTCLTMIQNNMTTTCPSYEDIMVIFPDTSNRYLSGDFVYENGFLHREKPSVEKHFEWYLVEKKPHLWIDPPANVLDRIDLITIYPDIPLYKDEGSHTMYDNATLTFSHTRYTDDRCMAASLDADGWATSLGDTLYYMKHDCNDYYTYLDTLSEMTFERMVFSFTSSVQYQLDQWFAEMATKCITWKCL